MSELTGDEIMDRAADLIDAVGWCRGQFRDKTGAVCLTGALRLADNPDDLLDDGGWVWVDPKVLIVANFIAESLENGGFIPDWNDHICENRYQAAELLRKQAKVWREEAAGSLPQVDLPVWTHGNEEW
jgi:hypothetical protein